MTEKDKAKELFTKMLLICKDTYFAKQCALIAVDEILYVIGEPTLFHETRAFWIRVKEEIEK